jgi:pimeloyl-ACP methyl ester carboxylesterase
MIVGKQQYNFQRRHFTSLIKKYSAVKRIPFPNVNPMDFDVKDREYESFKLANFEYKTVGNPKALLFFLPGFGESVNNYGYFFKRIAESGIAIYGFDQRGVGWS